MDWAGLVTLTMPGMGGLPSEDLVDGIGREKSGTEAIVARLFADESLWNYPTFAETFSSQLSYLPV